MSYGIKVLLLVLLIVSKVVIVAIVVVNCAAPLVRRWDHRLMLAWPTLRIGFISGIEICCILIILSTIAATSWLNNRQLLLFNGRFVVFIM